MANHDHNPDAGVPHDQGRAPWDPIVLTIVIDKFTGELSVAQNGIRNPEDMQLLIRGLNMTQERATDMLLRSFQSKPEPVVDEQEA